ncbi:uncharacterized protein VTP21DRAFT_7844 [Calcarisporiella thermophila]|uniref:uncharacterized protein n=1 Tax=Calcarisporiella thermophila TaxID=911321 RepID=UPI003743B777
MDLPLDTAGGAGSKLGSVAVGFAGLFATIASLISLHTIWMHLKNYRKPMLQRFTVRILWMVPIYALSSWISLVSTNASFYMDAIRDMYEAFVIYCFFNLLVYLLGGERALLIMLHSRPPTQHLFPVNWWRKEIYVGDPYSFLFVKRGILQFIYVKLILTLATMVLKIFGLYNEGYISWTSGYFWISFFYNLSVCLSLYCLMVFFLATKEDLAPFRPLSKFLCVKSVVFFSFWQGVLISLLVAIGLIRSTGKYTADNMAVAVQDFLICLEMVAAAIAHSYAFSYQDYIDIGMEASRMPVYFAFRDALGVKDIIQDTLDTWRGSRFNYRTFEPAEGLPSEGVSRTSRIRAGLRYTDGGASKHWIEPVGPPSRYYNRPGKRGGLSITSQYRADEPHSPSFGWEDESVRFPDVDPEDDIEEYYALSREMVFGDYNFPVVPCSPPRHPSRQPLLQTPTRRRLNIHGPKYSTLWKGKHSPLWLGKALTSALRGDEEPEEEEGPLMAEEHRTQHPPFREGCVDLVTRNGPRGELKVLHAQDNLTAKPNLTEATSSQLPHLFASDRSHNMVEPRGDEEEAEKLSPQSFIVPPPPPNSISTTALATSTVGTGEFWSGAPSASIPSTSIPSTSIPPHSWKLSHEADWPSKLPPNSFRQTFFSDRIVTSHSSAGGLEDEAGWSENREKERVRGPIGYADEIPDTDPWKEDPF